MGKKNRNTNKALKALKRRSSYRRGGRAGFNSEFLDPDKLRSSQPTKQPIQTIKTSAPSGTSRSGLGDLGFTDSQVASALKSAEAKTVASQPKAPFFNDPRFNEAQNK